MSATCSIPVDRVISEVLDDEAIIIDSVTGAYFTLDPLGSRVWAALSGGARNLDELAGPDDPPEVIAAVLAELAGHGLVVIDGALPEAAAVDPVLTKYTDMEELLLLDPIHDVDEAGWPIMPTDA